MVVSYGVSRADPGLNAVRWFEERRVRRGMGIVIVFGVLALPVAAAILMLIEELRVELPGQKEQAADVETRERDERGEEEYERRAEGMPAEQAAAIAIEITIDRHKEETGLVSRPDFSGSE